MAFPRKYDSIRSIALILITVCRLLRKKISGLSCSISLSRERSIICSLFCLVTAKVILFSEQKQAISSTCRVKSLSSPDIRKRVRYFLHGLAMFCKMSIRSVVFCSCTRYLVVRCSNLAIASSSRTLSIGLSKQSMLLRQKP